MGAWSTLKITEGTLRGHLYRTLYNGQAQAFDPDAVASEALDVAKRDVVRALTQRMAREMNKLDTPEEFMDVLAGIASVDDYLQDCLVLAWALRYYSQEGMGEGDKYALLAREAKRDFHEAVDALVEWASACDAVNDALDDASDYDVRLNHPLWAIG